MYKELAIDKEIEVINIIRELQHYSFSSLNTMIYSIAEVVKDYTKYLGLLKTEYDNELRLLFENMSISILFKKENEFSYRILLVYL